MNNISIAVMLSGGFITIVGGVLWWIYSIFFDWRESLEKKSLWIFGIGIAVMVAGALFAIVVKITELLTHI